jgi:hypothetical protein
VLGNKTTDRTLNIKSLFVVLLITIVTPGSQIRQFTSDNIEYVLDLPSPAWHVVSRIDVHDHPEFINGNDASNGYLRLRKILANQPTTPSELFRQQEKWELQRLPGYMVCSACDGVRFNGRLPATVFSYEYVSGGRAMSGRIYYLQINQRAFYALHFTVMRDKLPAVLEDMDSMARSFHLKVVFV